MTWNRALMAILVACVLLFAGKTAYRAGIQAGESGCPEAKEQVSELSGRLKLAETGLEALNQRFQANLEAEIGDVRRTAVRIGVINGRLRRRLEKMGVDPEKEGLYR